jgi:allantoin racemase
LEFFGAGKRSRTPDLRITNALLYQLSYSGVEKGAHYRGVPQTTTKALKRCLVINPNTTAAVTEKVVAACRQAQPAVQWEGATARFGAAYIADEGSYAIGAHAALDALDAFHAGHDAVLLACFGDPGLLALRERTRVPVIGLAQSSFEAAARRGRFAVVTGGHAWAPMLERFARAHGLDAHLAGIHTIDWTGAQIAADPDGAHGALLAAAQQGIDAGAKCILLGGAALTGLAPSLQPQLSAPLLDNVLLAAQAVANALR